MVVNPPPLPCLRISPAVSLPLANEWQLGGPQYTFTRDAFLAGELAIDCDGGNWFAPQAEEAGINYSIHPIPRWENGDV